MFKACPHFPHPLPAQAALPQNRALQVLNLSRNGFSDLDAARVLRGLSDQGGWVWVRGRWRWRHLAVGVGVASAGPLAQRFFAGPVHPPLASLSP